MPKICEVCNLTKSSNTTQSFHRFPTKKTTAQAWCNILNLDMNSLRKDAVICSDHFLPKDVLQPGQPGRRTIIMRTAMPVMGTHVSEAMPVMETHFVSEAIPVMRTHHISEAIQSVSHILSPLDEDSSGTLTASEIEVSEEDIPLPMEIKPSSDIITIKSESEILPPLDEDSSGTLTASEIEVSEEDLALPMHIKSSTGILSKKRLKQWNKRMIEFEGDQYETDSDSSDYNLKTDGNTASSSVTTTQGLKSLNSVSGMDMETEIKAKNCSVLDCKFFNIIEVRDVNHIAAECVSCKPKKCIINGSSITTINFINHLKKVHQQKYIDYLSYRTEKNRKRKLEKLKVREGEELRKKRENIDRNTNLSMKSYLSSPNSQSVSVSQKEFDNRILKFVIRTMMPLSIVEQDDFISLFEGFNVELLNRRTLIKNITELSDERETKLKNILLNVDYVCITVDIWSGKQKCFFGVTCHWIDTNFERYSAALCCKRFNCMHSYDEIVDLLEDVHIRYALDLTKVTAIITDNNTSFVESFKEFGLQNFIPYDEADEEETEDGLQYAEISLDNLEDEYRLPRHFRCASHELNLICTTDILTTINGNASMRSQHANTLLKCSLLWKKAALPKFANIIQETLGHTLSYPSPTRWTSFLDSVKQILNSREKLPKLYENLRLKGGLNANEIVYMEEYCEILEPIATTLDVLQEENNTYYGILIPCLFSLKNKLDKLKCKQFEQAGQLVDVCLNGLLRRFGSFFKLDKSVSDAVVATIVHPRFKLKWLNTAKKTCNSDVDFNYIKKLIIDEGTKFVNDSEISTEKFSRKDDDFFDFGAVEYPTESHSQHSQHLDSIVGTNMKEKNKIELEFLRYLDDSRSNFLMLDDYPVMKKIFIYTNTPLPSSAPVEKLFSFSTIINAPNGNALSDTNFENLILLRNYF